MQVAIPLSFELKLKAPSTEEVMAAIQKCLDPRFVATDLESSPSSIVPPAIGEVWPGQGGVYVGVRRGFDGQKDRYLILATDPRAVFEKRMLGTYGVDMNGADSDHDGMANTVAFASAGSDLCKEILALEIDGHKDFYLMAPLDGRLLMANASEHFKPEWYLTSKQYSESGAFNQSFDNGTQYHYLKVYERRSRFVRRASVL